MANVLTNSYKVTYNVTNNISSNSFTKTNNFNISYKGPKCEGSNPKVCGCASVKQADYRGTINTTASGKECQVWGDYYVENYPNAGFDNNNYCRNPEPERKEHAWCNTGEYEWDDCNVPICEDSLPSAYPSSSISPTITPRPTTSSPTPEPKCEGSNPEVCGCASVKQADYRGTISTTASGEECITWGDYYVEKYPIAGVEDNNYCRNPDQNRAGCYVEIGKSYPLSITFNACDVPYCFPPASSCPSSLDVNTNTSSISEELQTACAYHQCVVDSDYELLDNSYKTVTRSEVKSDCSCLFEVWDCAFGSMDCKLTSAATSESQTLKNANECCVSKLADSDSTSEASCECIIKPECEAGDSSKCNYFAENCCQENDQQCKCEYKTKACRLALEREKELDDYNDKGFLPSLSYCGGEYGGGARDACCGEDNYDIGLCTCDFWEPLCADFPEGEGTCYLASNSCCSTGDHCLCDLLTHAVEIYGFEDENDDDVYVIETAESTCVYASNVAPDIEVELQSLQSIYNETGGDYWYNNTGWTTEQDQCNWYGITCDEEDYVIEINLPNNNITGKFPSDSLSSFYNLQRIDLGNNSLHGIMAGTNQWGKTDASLFFNLRELTHVDLSQNNLSGEVDVLFAPALQYANFSHNNFTSINSFKKFKKSHETLTVCDVSHNFINTSASNLMMYVLPNIEELIVSSNLIQGPLPTTLEVLANLRRFDISMNVLSGELPDFSNSYPNLQVLDFKAR